MEQSLIPYGDVEKMGGVIARSGLFGVKTAEQAIALMLIAQAEGKHPATAAQEYHVIQGRASLKADQMLARFQLAGGSVKWIKRTDTEASAEFSHPQGGSLVISWTMDRAKKADLSGKDNWKKYPAQMLGARVISEGVRAVYPAACGSFYTPEEVQDFAPTEKPKTEDVTHVVVEDAKPEPKAVEAPKAVAEPEQKKKAVKKSVGTNPAPIDAPTIGCSELIEGLTRLQLSGTSKELAQYITANGSALNALPELDKSFVRNIYRETADAIQKREAKKGAVAA